MKKRITELMNGYTDYEYDLESRGVVDPERVKTLTLEKIAALDGEMPIKHPRKKRLNRTARIGLVAAILTIALSVTAYAVYQHNLDDRVLRVFEDNENDRTSVYYSPVGLDAPEAEATDSPIFSGIEKYWLLNNDDQKLYSSMGSNREYAALKEWMELYFNHDLPLEARDLLDYDDPHRLYAVGYGVLADKLDEIAEKYGLRLRQSETNLTMRPEEELFETLDMEPFYPVVEDEGHTVLVYDDGSFMAAGLSMAMPDGDVVLGFNINRAVRGTLSDFLVLGDDPAEMVFETYTTPSGVEVDLALGKVYSLLFADMKNCYISCEFYGGYEPVNEAPLLTMADLESVADSIDFLALDDFDVPTVAENVEAGHAQNVADNPDFYRKIGDRIQVVYDELGDYTLSSLPEGYQLSHSVAETVEDSASSLWADINGGCFASVNLVYTMREDTGTQGEQNIYLSYARYWSDREQTTLFNAENFYGHLDYMGDPQDFIDCVVGGFDGYYRVGDEFERCVRVTWYDTDQELIFNLSVPDGFTVEEAMALAETVTAE